MKALILIVLTSLAFGEKARFDNYRVYKILIENEVQLEALQTLAESSDSVIKFENLTVWNFLKHVLFLYSITFGNIQQLLVDM